MRLLALCALVPLLFGVAANAGTVTHDGVPGIVAMDEDMGRILDSEGVVWVFPAAQEWRPDPNTWQYPPFPIEQIKFWGHCWLITENNEWWTCGGTDGWDYNGVWPGVVGLDNVDVRPEAVAQAYPNPTDGLTTIQFQVPEQGDISVRLLDVAGRVVRELIEGRVPSGEYSLTWDGRDESGQPLPGGVYYAKIRTAEREVGQRIVLVR